MTPIDQLTDDELRVDVAKLCGARCFTEDGGAFWTFLTKDGSAFGDPLDDLNACAEFEKTLSVGEDELYRVQLGRLVLDMGPDDYLHWSDLGSISGLVSASARQRCIAFLKVKGVL